MRWLVSTLSLERGLVQLQPIRSLREPPPSRLPIEGSRHPKGWVDHGTFDDLDTLCGTAERRKGLDVTDGVTDEQVEKIYKIFLKYADTSSPQEEALDDLTLMGQSPEMILRIREKHEAETVRIRNLDEPPSVWMDRRIDHLIHGSGHGKGQELAGASR